MAKASYNRVIRGETPDPRPLRPLPKQLYTMTGINLVDKSKRPETLGKSCSYIGFVGVDDGLPYFVNLVYGYDSVDHWKNPLGRTNVMHTFAFDPGYLVDDNEISQKSVPKRVALPKPKPINPNDIFN
jgi:hypothetical protein